MKRSGSIGVDETARRNHNGATRHKEGAKGAGEEAMRTHAATATSARHQAAQMS